VLALPKWRCLRRPTARIDVRICSPGGGASFTLPEARFLCIRFGWPRSASATAIYTADEIMQVERDIRNLGRHTIEMGGGIELLQAALRVPPWQPLLSTGA
jgi:hypothetical protein